MNECYPSRMLNILIPLKGCRVTALISKQEEMWHFKGITFLQHWSASLTLLSPGGHASDSDDMLAGGQDGISFVNPIGEIFLHPLAGTMDFYFFLLVLFFLLFFPFSISSFLLPFLLPFPFMHFIQAYFTLQASSLAVVIVLKLYCSETFSLSIS